MLFCTCGQMLSDPNIDTCSVCHRKIHSSEDETLSQLSEIPIEVQGSTQVERGINRQNPITYEECPECGYERAHYVMIQNRSSDEPETIFLQCARLSCEHRWKKQ